MGYVYKQCIAGTREARIKFLDDARAEGLEYVSGLEQLHEVERGELVCATTRWALFRKKNEAACVRGPSAIVCLDGVLVQAVPLTIARDGAPHRVSIVVSGHDEVPEIVNVDVGERARVVGQSAEGELGPRVLVHEDAGRESPFVAGKVVEALYAEAVRQAKVGGCSISGIDLARSTVFVRGVKWCGHDSALRRNCSRCDEEAVRRVYEPVARHALAMALEVEQQERGRRDREERTQPQIDAERREMAVEIVLATGRSIVGFDDAIKRIAELERFAQGWVETAAQHACNEEYWRGRAAKAETEVNEWLREGAKVELPVCTCPPGNGWHENDCPRGQAIERTPLELKDVFPTCTCGDEHPEAPHKPGCPRACL